MNKVIVLLGILLLCGCTTNSGDMHSSANIPREETYELFYNCGSWLRNPNEIGIIAVWAVGAGWSAHDEQFDANNERISFYLTTGNYSETDIKLQIIEVLNISDNNTVIPVNKEFILKADTLELISLSPIDLSAHGPQVKLQIHYKIDDVSGVKDLCLQRRTRSELVDFITSNNWGYPWQSASDQ